VRLAGALAADAAALAVAARSLLAQARRHVLRRTISTCARAARELRVAVEDLEDDGGRSMTTAPMAFSRFPRLGRRDLVVDEDHVRRPGGDQLLQLLELPGAEVGAGVERLAPLRAGYR
jgi:hypothetical protein